MKYLNRTCCMLELNTEKEGFMAYTAPEDAQRPRAVYAINPDFRAIQLTYFYLRRFSSRIVRL